MQKVSKQSLAMIALSILLAISIALTVTFAATQVSKKATGSITFTGNYSIAWEGGTPTDSDTSGNGMKFTLSETMFNISANSDPTKLDAALNKTTGQTTLEGLKVTFTNATAQNATYTINFAQTSSDTGTVSCELAEAVATDVTVNANSTAEVSLYDLIESFSITGATGAEVTFTLTATIGPAA